MIRSIRHNSDIVLSLLILLATIGVLWRNARAAESPLIDTRKVSYACRPLQTPTASYRSRCTRRALYKYDPYENVSRRPKVFCSKT